jgi:hypothetical protein
MALLVPGNDYEEKEVLILSDIIGCINPDKPIAKVLECVHLEGSLNTYDKGVYI